MPLENKVKIKSWKEKYSYHQATVTRIENCLNKHTVAMEITESQMTSAISLEQLREEL